MTNKTLRIVYMGTPDFAVETLRRLVEEGYNVVGVVTMPDKAIGRHHEILQSSPVKQYATNHGIPVLQPEKLKDESFLDQLSALKADLQVVVAFRMLPEVVWSMLSLLCKLTILKENLLCSTAFRIHVLQTICHCFKKIKVTIVLQTLKTLL